MIFEDIFYPDNPKRREEISSLHGTIKAQFTQYQLAWNTMARKLSSALSQADNKKFNLKIKQLEFDITSNTINEAITEINSVLTDTREKLNKIVTDTGIIGLLPKNWKDVGFEFDGKTNILKGINTALAGVSTAASAFLTWYVYDGVKVVVSLIEIGTKMISNIASIAGGVLGGLIIGAIGFIVIDAVLSAILGALERDKLNDAITLLKKIETNVGDKLDKATANISGITQSIKDGTYKLDKTHILFLIDGKYVIMKAPESNSLKLVPDEFREESIIFASA